MPEGWFLLLFHGCATTPAPSPPPVRPDATPLGLPAPAPLGGKLDCAHGGGRECFERVPAGVAHDASGAEVRVAAFLLQRHEASLALFQTCVQAGWCAPGDAADDASPPSATTPDRPVVGLGWAGAARLCAFVGGRLPTDVEWDRAARGDDGRRFAWGDDPRCGRRSNEVVTTCALTSVASTNDLDPGGSFGLVGMSGNVWEWVADEAPADAKGGRRRYQRGGGWLSTDVADLETTARSALDPARQLPDVGVRCARDASP